MVNLDSEIAIQSDTTAAVATAVELAGLTLSNPTLTCSGTSGYAFEYAPALDYRTLGAFVTKSITLRERAGNEPPRVVETRGGMLNAIGLANVGLDRFIAEKVPLLRQMPCPVIVNVAGHSVDDYVQTVGGVSDLDCVAAIELNVSCPNVKDGLTFGTNSAKLKELTRAAKQATRGKPLIVKLSPNVEDITVTAAAAVEGGADMLSMINTLTGMSIDIWKRRPRLANHTGGLSGPAIKPIAIHMISRVFRDVAKDARIPIIGMGGVQTWQDAVEFILAGASAIAVGTALFIDPNSPQKISLGVSHYLSKIGCQSIAELVGAIQFD